MVGPGMVGPGMVGEGGKGPLVDGEETLHCGTSWSGVAGIRVGTVQLLAGGVADARRGQCEQPAPVGFRSSDPAHERLTEQMGIGD